MMLWRIKGSTRTDIRFCCCCFQECCRQFSKHSKQKKNVFCIVRFHFLSFTHLSHSQSKSKKEEKESHKVIIVFHFLELSFHGNAHLRCCKRLLKCQHNGMTIEKKGHNNIEDISLKPSKKSRLITICLFIHDCLRSVLVYLAKMLKVHS